MALDPRITFTERTYREVLNFLIRRIKARFPNDWQEFISTNPAMAILDSNAHRHGQTSHYIDTIGLNSALETAFLPESIINISKSQMGYNRRLPTSASVSVTLFPQPPQPAPVTIPKGEKLTVSDVVFESADDFVIPAGKPQWPDGTTDDIVVFVEGESRSETFESDGSTFQSFVLSQPSVIEGSVEVVIEEVVWEKAESLVAVETESLGNQVFIGDGNDNQTYQLSLFNAIIASDDEDEIIVTVSDEEWERVEIFTGAPKEYQVSQDSDGVTTITFGTNVDGTAPPFGSVINITYEITGAQQRYVAKFDQSARATIFFGDGNTGIIPPDGAIITVNYRVGGGVRGNAERGSINNTVRGLLSSGASINVRVFNQEAGSGGNEIQSLELVKMFAPLFAKSNTRAVRKEDWDVLASTFRDPQAGAPAFASARIKQKIPESNEVLVAVWSRDNKGRISLPTTPLKRSVKEFLDNRRTICTRVTPIDGNVLVFDITLGIVLSSGKVIANVLNAVTVKLQELFNSSFALPGRDLSLPLIAQEVLSVPGVEQSSVEDARGSNILIIDEGLGDNVTKTFSGFFRLPEGQVMIPGSFEITDGEQTISDDGEGNLEGDVDTSGTNLISYETGEYSATFIDAPSDTQFVSVESRIEAFFDREEFVVISSDNRIDGVTDFSPIVKRPARGIAGGITVNTQLPEEFLPYNRRRVFFVGGFDNFGTQPGGQILALDDGSGNIVGDVVPGGTVNYETGEVNFTWNTNPAPVITTTFFGRLLSAPNGTNRTFDFEVRTLPGGAGLQVNLQTLFGLGRIRFDFSGLSTANVTFNEGFDNGIGGIHSPDLDFDLRSSITYVDGSGFSSGELSFIVAPEASAGQDFIVEIGPTTLFYYSAFTAFIIDDTTGGYEKFLVVDQEGRFFGDAAEAFPFANLDHLCGRFKTLLASPSAAGKQMTVVYHPYSRSSRKNIPIGSLTMSSLGTVSLIEIPQEVNV